MFMLIGCEPIYNQCSNHLDPTQLIFRANQVTAVCIVEMLVAKWITGLWLMAMY